MDDEDFWEFEFCLDYCLYETSEDLRNLQDRIKVDIERLQKQIDNAAVAQW
jgi:hypothetical protein